MSDDLPAKIRYITRNGKGGQVWGSYYWDGRSRGLGEVPLGTDKVKALQLLTEYEANAPTPAKKRRVVREFPGWLALPGVMKDAYRAAVARSIERGRDCLSAEEMAGLWERCGGYCEVSGVHLDLITTGGPFMPSIDRIDSRSGYEAPNCRIVCTLVNYAMNVWGEAPLRTVAESLLRNQRAEVMRK